MIDKLELKSSHEVVYIVNVEDVESIFYCKPTDPDILTVLMTDGKRLYCDEVCPVDSLQEEPVSNNYSALLPCIYNRTLEERVKYCKYCSAACEGRVKEPVSEDLEKAADIYGDELDNVLAVCDDNDDDNTIGEYAKEAFKAGAEWADKSMADKVIEVEIVGLKKQILDGSCGYFEIEGNYKEGDKLKIIVVKED